MKYQYIRYDMSNHCVIATIRRVNLPKARPHIIMIKCDYKHFCEQGFHLDLWYFDWSRISLFNDVFLAWKYFYDAFSILINEHAPLRKFRNFKV